MTGYRNKNKQVSTRYYEIKDKYKNLIRKRRKKVVENLENNQIELLQT